MYWLGLMLIVVLAPTSVTAANAGLRHADACLPDSAVSAAVRRLSSPLSDLELTQVERVLFENAQKSAKCRKQVIAALISAMDRPKLDLFRDPAAYDTWTYGAGFLGELKAVEALDFLISHLTITDGLSPNMNHYPAVEGVTRMGPKAIPKLSVVLRHNADRNMRRIAIFCIAQIGGPSAMRSLEEALDSESDRCNGEFIKASIGILKNELQGNQTKEKDRQEWYSAFFCDP
jgi:hypothetical protein